MGDSSATFSIGELAEDAGVSRQTLRHYDELGLLRPTARTASGYRRYSVADRARLELIRTLRELDIDLETIRRLLRGSASLAEIARLQADTLEHQARVVHRRLAVIRVFLEHGDALDGHRLRQLQTLSKLERAEQQHFVAAQLALRLGRAGGTAMRSVLLDAARVELPEHATREQLEAWLELAELVSDPAFLREYHEAPSAPASRDAGDAEAWRRRLFATFREAAAAMRDGLSADADEARPIVRRWLAALARQQGRRDVAAFAREMLVQANTARHRRERRFWELLAVLRPDVARSPAMVASPWLIEGVRAWVASPRATPSRRVRRPRLRGSGARGRAAGSAPE